MSESVLFLLKSIVDLGNAIIAENSLEINQLQCVPMCADCDRTIFKNDKMKVFSINSSTCLFNYDCAKLC